MEESSKLNCLYLGMILFVLSVSKKREEKKIKD